MNNQSKQKKQRWNISKTFGIISSALKESDLKIKETVAYTKALKKLMEFYKLNKIQIWILSLMFEEYYGNNKPCTLKAMSKFLKTSIMNIISWKSEIDNLCERQFVVWFFSDTDFTPFFPFCESLFNNTDYIPENRKIDDFQFLSILGFRVETRRNNQISQAGIHKDLRILENQHSNLDVVKRVKLLIHDAAIRFLIYDLANDVIQGGESSLNVTISDLYDGYPRVSEINSLMDETHPLLKMKLIEFVYKGTIRDSKITLTEEGKKLLLGDKATLFEDKTISKNMIKVEDIKAKKLFYSSENQLEIDRLKDALKDKNFKKIQERLKEKNLPQGFTVILYGGPGTGKTESVMQIAKETGRSVIHVDISETKSAWYGESEKLIKKIFTSYKNLCDRAEQHHELIPILLFNEADALISKRLEVTPQSTVRTENSMQNIILEELENLKGIFIATTNLVENMDAAFERRFLFKIKFENPSVEAKKLIWMDKISWLDEDDAAIFARGYDFSGGQIDNIVRKMTMDEVITGKHTPISEIQEICNHEKYKNDTTSRPMGFCV
ncbi:MAG: ATP-binding protein [Treponema sp.]|nr:ATP-binding protein [Treponema sp.]